MKNIKISFFRDVIREMDEYDYFGRLVPREKSTKYRIEMPISFLFENYKLNSQLEAWVYKDILPLNFYKDFILSLIIELFPEHIKTLNSLNIFDVIDFHPLPTNEHKMKLYEKTMFEIEVDANVKEELFNDLLKQKEKDYLSKQTFDSAKDILYEFACKLGSGDFEFYARDIRKLISYLDCCYSQSYSYDSWSREKLSRLRSSFEELIRRKMENDKYLYYLDDARTNAYVLQPPKSWYREPPDPNSFEINEIIKKYSCGEN